MKITHDYTEYDKDLAQVREVINETVQSINARRELHKIGYTKDEWLDMYPEIEEIIASRKAIKEAISFFNHYRKKHHKDNGRTSLWMTMRFVADFIFEYGLESADPYTAKVKYLSNRMKKIPKAEL